MTTQIKTRLADKYQLTAHAREEIDELLSHFPADQKKSALLGALTVVQHENNGFLTEEIMEAVADYLELPPVWAHEIVSFYSMFFTEPVGRHKVNICTNISCWLNGADRMVEHAEKKLGVKLGETTADGRITLVREEECLAGCCGAPMAVVDGHYKEHLDIEKLDALLDGLE